MKHLTRFWIWLLIRPLLIGLQRTDSGTIEVKVRDQLYVFNNNHTLYDGYEVPEGCYAEKDWNKYRAAKRTAQQIIEIRRKYRNVFLRMGPEAYNGFIYLRLITEGDNT